MPTGDDSKLLPWVSKCRCISTSLGSNNHVSCRLQVYRPSNEESYSRMDARNVVVCEVESDYGLYSCSVLSYHGHHYAWHSV